MSVRFYAISNLWSHVKMRIEEKSKNWLIARLIVFNKCAVTQRRRTMEKWAYVNFFSVIWRFEWSFDEYSRSYIRGGDTFASCVCLVHQGGTYLGRSSRTKMMESSWELYAHTQFWTLNSKKMVAKGIRPYPKWKSLNLAEKSLFFVFVRKLHLARFCSENTLRKGSN
jgi:hypothetical protein